MSTVCVCCVSGVILYNVLADLNRFVVFSGICAGYLWDAFNKKIGIGTFEPMIVTKCMINGEVLRVSAFGVVYIQNQSVNLTYRERERRLGLLLENVIPDVDHRRAAVMDLLAFYEDNKSVRWCIVCRTRCCSGGFWLCGVVYGYMFTLFKHVYRTPKSGRTCWAFSL